MKRLNVLLCSLGVTCFLTGCGSAMPDLTEEENEVITEYAVSLLLKYDKNHTSRLIDLTAYEEEQSSQEETIEPEEEPIPEEEETEESSASEETEVVDISEEPVISTIDEFYGIEGFSFQYAGYELASEYPNVSDNEGMLSVVMNASPGTQLLILKFQVFNQTGVEQQLNMIDYDMNARVSLDGEPSKHIMNTMLLNDLGKYIGTVSANEPAELIGIIEIPEGVSPVNIEMILSGAAGSAVIALQ